MICGLMIPQHNRGNKKHLFLQLGSEEQVLLWLMKQFYIAGGKNTGSKASNHVWAYNFKTDSWLQKNDMPFAGRWRGSATELNGKVY